MSASIAGSRKSLGRSFPGCGRGVMVPTSTNPNPIRNQAGTRTFPLSIPAARPIGDGKRSPKTERESERSGDRGRAGTLVQTLSKAAASSCARSGSSAKRKGRTARYTAAPYRGPTRNRRLRGSAGAARMNGLDASFEQRPFAAPPQGTQDLLFEAARRLRRCEAALAHLFEERGFAEVIPPALESAEVFALASPHGEAGALRAVDRHGHLLALRADFTAQVARIAATRLAGVTPLRLYYRGSVVREGLAETGTPRERLQAGCELVGVEGPEADAEMLDLAAHSLRILGLSGSSPRLAVGTVGYFSALERLSKVLAGARAASAELEVDLGEVRGLGYYTGLVFNLYAAGAPRAVGGGGRYDGLLGKFGDPRPAVGFSLDLDALVPLA